MRLCEIYSIEYDAAGTVNEENVTVRYHGSPHKFDKFQTKDIFLAKDKNEAKRYGPYVYKVEYTGKPKFETATIEVIDPMQIKSLKIIEHNPTQTIFRT